MQQSDQGRSRTNLSGVLPSDREDLSDSGKLIRMVLVTGGCLVPAIRTILSMSPVLRRIFLPPELDLM